MSWDGKICDKYRIEHTDGTPLKGKKYFVLRLDSDDSVEAARVNAAMRAYKGNVKTSVGNAVKMREALVQCELFLGNVSRHGHPTLNPGDKCTACDGADELRGMVARALSAPQRNCDLFSGDPNKLHKLWWEWSGDLKNCNADGTVKFTFGEWLLKPAEAKGGEK